MKEILNYIEQVLQVGFKEGKFSGHAFFSGFPQPQKTQVDKYILDALYYAVTMLIENHDGSDVSESRYDFIRDIKLKTQPWSHGKIRIYQWNLWNTLKMIKGQIK